MRNKTRHQPASLTGVQIGSAQRRIVNILKTQPDMTAAKLAEQLNVTRAAIRLQLNELEKLDLVQQQLMPAAGRGRPTALWSLTETALQLFPDRHSDLTIELIRSIRESLGEKAFSQVLKTRDKHLLQELNIATPELADLTQKVKILAKIRSHMGYMAEVKKVGTSLLLTEHHCPVCAAAQACQGLCRNELRLFQNYLGEEALIQRVEHLLSGDTRCTYQIEPSVQMDAGSI